MSISRQVSRQVSRQGPSVAAGLLVAIIAVGLHTTARASSARFFQTATQADFLKGDIENLSIDSRGQLMLGPVTELVYETPSPFLWALAPGPNGSLFVGTGNEGRVFRIETQGALGRGASFFDAGELEVHAVAAGPDGGVYAASSPDGRIYKVDRNGRGAPFFDPEDKYIWALATDARGNLYAGTGDKGIVYKIGADGRGEPFYRTRATHATALAFDRAGNLLVGTESPGRLFRVDANGRGFLVLDTPFDEIRSLRFDEKGVLYVAAVSARGSGGSVPPPSLTDSSPRPASDPGRPGIPTVTVEVTSVGVTDSSATGGSSSDEHRTARGAIYRVAPDGLWDQLWESPDDVPYDVVLDNEGRIIVATGSKGKIYRLEGDPLRPTLLARANAQQVTALYKDPRGAIYYATANPGKLYRLTAALAPQGTFVSEVQDAKTVSTWGTISWRGTTASASGARVEVSTRSGNTQTPDDTWSPWSAPYPAPGAAIASPKARYLQWRALLSGRGQSPVLTSAIAAYLQNNLRPQVRSITVHPPGIVFQKPYPSGDPDLAGFDNQTTPERRRSADASGSLPSGSPQLGRRAYDKGLQTLVWKAEDENGDELLYDVDYRREGDASWKPLRHEIADLIYVWDTTTVPNGTYFVRVRASDAPSNGREAGLWGELESSAFDVDNTAPRFSTPAVRVDGSQTLITFEVTDDQSPIQRVELSRDGQRWVTIFPRDGIADSVLERYEAVVEGTIGPRGISLRALDAMDNVATTQVESPARR